ncbi:Integrase core domain-containing protein [Salipiger profundus]|nr:Integrase core domain-containing protein [Salipiger profundus]
MAQRLDNLEHHGVPQRRVRDLEIALDHHPFGQLPRRHFHAIAEVMHADLGDLALLEEPVAHDVARSLALWGREQLNGRVHMGEVVLGMRYLRLIRLDLPKDLRALLLQCLDDQGVTHVPDCTLRRRSGPSGNLVHLLPKTELLDLHIFETIDEVQQIATEWLWSYNNDRPNIGNGGMTPAQKLRMAAQILRPSPRENGGLPIDFSSRSLFAARYDRCPKVFLSAIALAATVIYWL